MTEHDVGGIEPMRFQSYNYSYFNDRTCQSLAFQQVTRAKTNEIKVATEYL